MKRLPFGLSFICLAAILILSQCAEKHDDMDDASESTQSDFGGYDTQVKWGEHLVTICGCNDCHTPKKMGPRGPELDSTLLLSGHPANLPPADIDRKMLESKGIVATNLLTAWIGPWGISYSANLTSDETGIGSWQESNFITSIREGKFKGISNGRPLLPPMPWQMHKHMTDDELKAVFAYLKSTKPVKNVVPEPTPPVMAAAQ